jgi:hypothetical protein
MKRDSDDFVLFSLNISFILHIASLEEDHMPQLVGPILLLVGFNHR